MKDLTDKNFGGRLGTHLGFYYWNQASSRIVLLRKLLLMHFFAVLLRKSEPQTIADIGRIFSGITSAEENKTLCELAMALWRSGDSCKLKRQ